MIKNELLHFCWLLMDFCWLLGIKYLAIFMIIPTLIITFIILRKKELVSIESIFASWTLMNIFWMMSEWFTFIPFFLSKIFLIVGFTIFVLYLHDEYLLSNGITKKEKY